MRRRFSLLGLSLAALAVLGCHAQADVAPTTAATAPTTAPSTRSATDAGSPITIERLTLEGPLKVTVARVDLADPRVRLVVRPGTVEDPDGEGRFVTRLQTVRTIAQRDGLALAINGDFFEVRDSHTVLGRRINYFVGNPARPVGWMMVDGKLLSTPQRTPWAVVVIDKQGRPQLSADYRQLPADAHQAIGGSQIIVQGGKPVLAARDASRAPRSSLGLSADGRTLLLVAIDGRMLDYSVGVNFAELAKIMIDLGAAEAINLDGGGSTTLVYREPRTLGYVVLNRPSDGHELAIPLSVERPVVDVIGVIIDGDGQTPGGNATP